MGMSIYPFEHRFIAYTHLLLKGDSCTDLTALLGVYLGMSIPSCVVLKFLIRDMAYKAEGIQLCNNIEWFRSAGTTEPA